LTSITVHGACIATLTGIVGTIGCSFRPCVAAPMTMMLTALRLA
jgi:hypothetical protein